MGMTEAQERHGETEAEGDETLEIVRLMIETEERHAQTHGQPMPESDESPEKRRHTKHARQMSTPDPLPEDQPPEEAGAAVIAPMPEAPRAFEPLRHAEAEPPATPQEDLRRKRRFLPPMPRLKLPMPRFERKGKAPLRAAQMSRPELVQYAKLAALVVVALIIFFKPWVLPLVLFVLVWLSLILFLVLGGARISELMQAGWRGYALRRPEASARMLARLQRAADRADGLLARLPEKWADGIYTPDLGRSAIEQSAAAEAELAEDPFEKLGMREAP